MDRLTDTLTSPQDQVSRTRQPVALWAGVASLLSTWERVGKVPRTHSVCLVTHRFLVFYKVGPVGYG